MRTDTGGRQNKFKLRIWRLRQTALMRGIALGAFGEFSESINVLIQGLAHGGALKNPDKFGQSNYKAA
jgi:hypothetical protein